jgi:hypothetical protein
MPSLCQIIHKTWKRERRRIVLPTRENVYVAVAMPLNRNELITAGA